MALKKDIKQDNGIVLTYHRIVGIENIINDKTILQVHSYLDKEQREKERNKVDGDIYIVTNYEIMDYNDTLTAHNAYDYLKTLEKYEDAEDI